MNKQIAFVLAVTFSLLGVGCASAGKQESVVYGSIVSPPPSFTKHIRVVKPGTKNALLGSYNITAPTTKDVMLSTIVIGMGSNWWEFENIQLDVSQHSFPAMNGTIPNAKVFVFPKDDPIVIPRRSFLRIDIYGDVLDSATTGTKPAVTTLFMCGARERETPAPVKCRAMVRGQDLTINTTTK